MVNPVGASSPLCTLAPFIGLCILLVFAVICRVFLSERLAVSRFTVAWIGFFAVVLLALCAACGAGLYVSHIGYLITCVIIITCLGGITLLRDASFRALRSLDNCAAFIVSCARDAAIIVIAVASSFLALELPWNMSLFQMPMPHVFINLAILSLLLFKGHQPCGARSAPQKTTRYAGGSH